MFSISRTSLWLCAKNGNTIRDNRGLGALNAAVATSETLTNEIKKEYQKEFYAEGQVFFYYKRVNAINMQFSSRVLDQKSYVLPIPDSETEFNNQY